MIAQPGVGLGRQLRFEPGAGRLIQKRGRTGLGLLPGFQALARAPKRQPARQGRLANGKAPGHLLPGQLLDDDRSHGTLAQFHRVRSGHPPPSHLSTIVQSGVPYWTTPAAEELPIQVSEAFPRHPTAPASATSLWTSVITRAMASRRACRVTGLSTTMSMFAGSKVPSLVAP